MQHIWLIFASLLCTSASAVRAAGPEAVDIGMRVEMFVDGWLIADKHDVELKLTPPARREVVLTMDQAWEDETAAYFTVFQDGPLIRMYYRGFGTDDANASQPTCYAQSTDGVHFTRPDVGLYEFNGSKKNNIVYMGVESAGFAPFLDGNPNAKADEKYKAIGYGLEGGKGVLIAFSSPDGLRWTRMQAEPVMPPGTFDSQNVAFWDPSIESYRCYSRYWTGGEYAGLRGIQSATSKDFLHWSALEPNRYTPPQKEQYYTNVTTLCPGAAHLFLSFPMRFLEERKINAAHPYPGVSDAVFMTSRDGVNWDRTFREAWVRPGRDPKNWTQRSNMPAWGVVQTAPDEFSMYVSEHYYWPDNRIRRLTIRRHGFASIHAGADGGEFTTRPVRFAGKHLILNAATSAVGSVRVEVQNEAGEPFPGFALADAQPFFGDDLDAVASWKGGSDLSSLTDKPVRFRFVLDEADVYSIRTGEPR